MNNLGPGLSSLDKYELDESAVIETIDTAILPENCFHCGLPIPSKIDIRVVINHKPEWMCCFGCQAVAQMIVESGHEHFYRVRTSPSQNANELVPDFLPRTAVYDNPTLQSQFVTLSEGNHRQASLMLEGITCAACVWLNERHVAKIPGVISMQVNYATARARVCWDQSQTSLGVILQAIREIGYTAYPYNADQKQALAQNERRMQLRRLAVSGLFGMQIMMISIALYAAEWTGMTRGIEALFRWLSLGLTVPVILYAGLPFYRAAWSALKHGNAVMDLPVAIAISLAFIASTITTLKGQGATYFDSIAMFVFFLLVSRYFEWCARQKSADLIERLAFALPAVATKLDAKTQNSEVVAASELNVGDLLLIRPGETVPADGDIVEGQSSLDESLINGESLAVTRRMGDRLVGGSINIESPLHMKVVSVGSDTVLSSIQRMALNAQENKSAIAQFADKIAGKFIFSVLLITAVVSLYWWNVAPEYWLEITLAVLIVTCPCALSLATPAAISSALGKMYRLGILVKNSQVLELLSRVTHVVFDKTGTLTKGAPTLNMIKCRSPLKPEDCLEIAAALENYSEHPLARALVKAAGGPSELRVSNVINKPGSGLYASIDGQDYAIGNIEFVEQFCKEQVPQSWLFNQGLAVGTAVAMAARDKMFCLFVFHDDVREDAVQLVEKMWERNLQVMILSGDQMSVVSKLSGSLGVSNFQARLSPEDKMRQVTRLQSQGAVVLMVGDGINDAPVLSVADVSIAMGSATSIAKTSADVVLLTDQLLKIHFCFDHAIATQRIIRQNLGWAIGYNLCAIPFAASGYITPWMAAIGMSLSSLIVVANALRLAR